MSLRITNVATNISFEILELYVMNYNDIINELHVLVLDFILMI